MKHALLLVFSCIFLEISAQTPGKVNDTIFNQTDKQGLKQGYWKVKYSGGTIKYTAFYKDNKPVGLMKRYFDDNTPMAELFFYPNSTRIKAKLYFQAGPVAAEGIYSQKDVKDSVWNYYSYYTKKLKSRETYVNGKKHGMAYNYFEDGSVAEERGWRNGLSHGIWRQYYPGGKLKLSSSYINDKREGSFIINYSDGRNEWVGAYKNDKREGKWTHYDPSGNIISVTEYKEGVALNADELQAKEQKILDNIEKQRGKIPEPDETNIMPGSH